MTNLLDCTAVAAALFSNTDHILHLNEHATLSEIPKLDPAVTPKKYLLQIYRAMVGLSAGAAPEEIDNNVNRREQQRLPREPGTLSSSWLDDDNNDESEAAHEARRRALLAGTPLKPGAQRGGTNRFNHPNALRAAALNAAAKELHNPQRNPNKTSTTLQRGVGQKKNPNNSRSSSTDLPVQLQQQQASTTKTTAVSPLESKLSRKSTIIANVVRGFLTHRLYRRQGLVMNSSSDYNGEAQFQPPQQQPSNTIWLGSGFINLRYAAPVMCGIAGRVLHLSAVKEAEMASVAVARCMELLDACIVSSDLLASSTNGSGNNTTTSISTADMLNSFAAPPSVFPVPVLDVTISRHAEDAPNTDELSATWAHDTFVGKHVNAGTGARKLYCSVQVRAPLPPFAPPVFLVDLVRAMVLAGPDALRSYLHSSACCEWIAATQLPPLPGAQQQQQQNHHRHPQEHAEFASPYRSASAMSNQQQHHSTSFTATAARNNTLWHTYLESLIFIAGENRAEDVAELIRALAALVVATEIRLVPAPSTFLNRSNRTAAANATAGGDQFTRAASKCGLLPATLRDAQGLTHLADLLQQPSAEALLSTIQAVPTGGRTTTVPFHMQQQNVDASIPHFSSRTGGLSGSSASSASSMPLLKIAFVPDTIYRNVLGWILSAVNTRLQRLSCVGAGVRETTRIVVALGETRTSQALFGTLQHSALPMHLVSDVVADSWRRIHTVLEKQHALQKKREQRRALRLASGEQEEGDHVDDFTDDEDHDDELSAIASTGNNVGVVGSAEWMSPMLLPLLDPSEPHQQSQSQNQQQPIRSTAQLVMRWPLAGVLLHGLAPSTAALRKLRMGTAISHHATATTSGTLQLQHSHGTVTYTSMTTGATPCFIIADDDASKRFAATAQLFGSAADDTLAAQRWRQAEHRAALEALESYCATLSAIVNDARSSRMDQDFLFLSLGYSHLARNSNSTTTTSSYSLLDSHALDGGNGGVDRGSMFLDSTAAQAVAMRFRMNTVAKTPVVPKMLFPHQSSSSSLTRNVLWHSAVAASSSAPSSAFPSRSNTPLSTATTTSSATAAAASAASAASSTARAYEKRHIPNPLATVVVPALAAGQQQQQRGSSKSLSVVSTAADQPRNKSKSVSTARASSTASSRDEPDPAPPTPQSVPLVYSMNNNIKMQQQQQQQKEEGQREHQPTRASDWLRFDFADFCGAFFEPVRDELEQIDGLGSASDDVFVAAICTARGLRPNNDFILLPEDRQVLVAKVAVARMNQLHHHGRDEDESEEPVRSEQRNEHEQHQHEQKEKPQHHQPELQQQQHSGPIPVRMTKTGAYNNNSNKSKNRSRSRSPSLSSVSARSSSLASSHNDGHNNHGAQLVRKFTAATTTANRSAAAASATTRTMTMIGGVVPVPVTSQEFSVDAFKAMRDEMVNQRNTAAAAATNNNTNKRQEPEIGEKHPQLRYEIDDGSAADEGDHDEHENTKRSKAENSPARVVAVGNGPSSLDALSFLRGAVSPSPIDEVDSILMKQQQQQSFVRRPVEENRSEFSRHEFEEDIPTISNFSSLGEMRHSLLVSDRQQQPKQQRRALFADPSNDSAFTAPVTSPRRSQLESEVASLLSHSAAKQQRDDDHNDDHQHVVVTPKLLQPRPNNHAAAEDGERPRRSLSSIIIDDEELEEERNRMRQQEEEQEAERQRQLQQQQQRKPRLLDLGVNNSAAHLRQMQLQQQQQQQNPGVASPEQSTTLKQQDKKAAAVVAQHVQQRFVYDFSASSGSGAPPSLSSFLGGAGQSRQEPQQQRSFYSL